MTTVSIGPFVFNATVFWAFASLLAAVLLAAFYERRYQTRLEIVVWLTAFVGLLFGRLSFVIQYWDHYRQQPISIIDIRDGGLIWQWVLFGMAAVLAIALWRSSRVRKRGIFGCLLAGAAVWGAGFAYVQLQQEPSMSLPNLTLTDLNLESDQSVNLNDYLGKPIVLNLWATWCPPCRREMPVLQAAQRQYSDAHFVFANQQESDADVLSYLATENLELRNLLQDKRGELAGLVNSNGLPTTLFIDASGTIKQVRMGEVSSASLAHELEKIGVR